VSPKPRAAATATAPAESLSPGESLVAEQGSLPKPAPPKSEARPAEPPPAPKVAPAPKPQPQTPAYNRSPRCPSCGVVSSTTYRAYRREAGDAWEIRIKLDSGTRRVVRFANDPGFRAGDRIRWKDGRLTRE
jgi:hypothetical protein